MTNEATGPIQSSMETDLIRLYKTLLEYQIRSVCSHHHTWLRNAGINLLKINNWEAKLESIQKEERLLNHNMKQYNSEMVKHNLQALLKNAQSQEETLVEIQETLEQGHKQAEWRHRDAMDNACLRDLCATDPRADKKRIEEMKGGLLKDSYSWIIQHQDFQRFLADPDMRLLWIKGDPGKGKTMLMCGIIDELNASKYTLSYFFCQQTNSYLNEATCVLRGLMFTLVNQCPDLLPCLRSKYDEQGSKLFESINAWVSLKDIFCNMIQSSYMRETVILVDALDECATGRAELLSFIQHCIALDVPNVKWILSSRNNWSDIEETLRATGQKQQLRLELNQDLVVGAIRSYIKHEIQKLTLLKGYSVEMQDEIASKLDNEASDTFLWVSLVCQRLTHVPRRRALQELRTFPPGLDAFYNRMMGDVERGFDAEICKEILAVMCTVFRSLTLPELKSLVPSMHDFDMDEVEELVAECGSFLTLQGDTIWFVHQSAKDFSARTIITRSSLPASSHNTICFSQGQCPFSIMNFSVTSTISNDQDSL